MSICEDVLTTVSNMCTASAPAVFEQSMFVPGANEVDGAASVALVDNVQASYPHTQGTNNCF